jgi:two-component system sensor histidine kinase RegB
MPTLLESPSTLNWPLLLSVRTVVWLVWLSAFAFAPWLVLDSAETWRFSVVIGMSLALTVFFAIPNVRARFRIQNVAPILFLWDNAAHALLLYSAGGITNPLASFSIVFVVAAALTLPEIWTWLLAFFAVASKGALLHYYHPMAGKWQIALDVRGMPARLSVFFAFSAIVLLVAALSSLYHRRLIFEQKRLAQSRERAEQSQRAALIASLAASAAHELGTPLATIVVAAHELERRFADDRPLASADVASAAKDSHVIALQARRARQVLDRLARGEIADPRERTLFEIDEFRHILALEVGDSTAFSLESTLGHVLVHRSGTLSILTTLIRNAVQAGANRIILSIVRERGHLIFALTDNGPGLTDELLARLGQPYPRSGIEVGGSPGHLGLGLFCAYLVADQLGAELIHRQGAQGGTLATLRVAELKSDA